jgi:hypothetical protein
VDGEFDFSFVDLILSKVLICCFVESEDSVKVRDVVCADRAFGDDNDIWKESDSFEGFKQRRGGGGGI